MVRRIFLFVVFTTFFTPLYSQGIKGLDVEFALTSDFAYNVDGGVRKGGVYIGNIDLILSLNTEEFGWWKGGEFYFYGLNNHGSSISYFVGDLQGVDNIETISRSKIYQLWYRQRVGDFEFTFGQHDLNSVFANTEVGGSFINSSFGIQPDISSNIPVSIFPFATLGFITKWNINKRWDLLLGIYEGCPDETVHTNYINWNIDKADGVVGISEAHYHYLKDGEEKGTFKFGMWVHNKLPEESGGKINYGVNSGVYFIADYNLYSESDADAQGLSCFTQLGYVLNDLDYIHSYGSFGLLYTGIFRNRDEDELGLAATLVVFNKGTTYPDSDILIRNESTIELFYKAEIFNHFSLQPDLQYVINPGAIANLENAFVVNVRAKLEL